jgi:DNA-binding NtrC family response regulator
MEVCERLLMQSMKAADGAWRSRTAGTGSAVGPVERLRSIHSEPVPNQAAGCEPGTEQPILLSMGTAAAPGRVLLVDDDPSVRESLASVLESPQYELATALDGASAIAVASGFSPEVVLLDLCLPDVEGLQLIPRLREVDELAGIVVLTATNEISVVVEAMHLGADNFLVKPVGLATLEDVLARTLRKCRQQRRLRALVARTAGASAPKMVGSSRAMQDVTGLIAQVADTEATVLLEGESGTGKGMAAEEIHRLSNRSNGPFLDMNCAALSPALLESELFGHERGAFTDASRSKPGLLEIASGGTVFLDEIGEMPLEVQSKLLKVLEDRRFRRVGGLNDLYTNVRLVTATNRNLKEMVRSGAIRQDLYYRLNVFAIRIPPLRERTDDIIELAHHFLGHLNRSLGTEVTGFEPAVIDILNGYGWPGNARELRNVVERALILARDGMVGAHHLPADIRQSDRGGRVTVDLKPLSDVEREHIERVLAATGGNIKRTSELLAVSRTTLYNKIRAYSISVPEARS